MKRPEYEAVRSLRSLFDKTVFTQIAPALQNAEEHDPYTAMYTGITQAQKKWEKKKNKPTYQILRQGVIEYTMQTTQKLLETTDGNAGSAGQTREFMADFAVTIAGRLDTAEGRSYGRREEGNSLRWDLSQLWLKESQH